MITAEELKARQSMPLHMKVALTKSAITRWYEHWDGKVYVSFSGGKDSTVLRHIVKGMYSDVPAVFCDTGLEYPEVRELARRKADVVIKPKMNFRQVIDKYGYPFPSKEQAQFIRELRTTKSEKLRNLRLYGKGDGTNFGHVSKRWLSLVDAPFPVSEQCCNVMKKQPFKAYCKTSGRKAITGVMAEESQLREKKYLQHGCNAFEGKDPKSTPIAFWTEQDVLRYLVDNDLEYASCYGDIVERGGTLTTTGVNRTGCMFCMFGVQFDKEPNRFQRMQKNYPKQYDYCINKLGIGQVLDYVGIPYERQPELFDLEVCE